ncbi:FimV/HubP family polar landmark protein [Alloalcanivorax gelatiniphagus]|uniref:Peptigoglycan-binding protein LysM n=3 Tax=Alloalcanivorax gelatiniphagus TaxID=1194167 RepID=A0ABY2XQ89_9GAMM|nr:FimV/HubP family polar landmark protein [Alloalcanivorax gelatiniphagus]TMW14089.1 peptigoglycan-binding protein LysM [Alloalcanivorax gelatiniphagus]
MLRKLGIGIITLATLTPGLSAALGVGEYRLNSYLNEPLDMTVELQDLGDLSREQILVELASQEQFDAAGVERGYFLNDLNFQVTLDGKRGELHITSDQPVREPYLDFLVEFLWPTGRLMREYTILLDPPSYGSDSGVSPARSEAPPRATSPVPTPARPQPARPQSERPQSERPQPARPQPARPAAERPAPERPAVAERPRVAPRPAATNTSANAAGGTPETYRVRASDTLWRIADRTRPGTDVSVQQMMLAIQESNPDAFINDNVNLVREGAVLRLPDGDQVRRLSNRDALARVATQNQQWQRLREQRQAPADAAPVDATGRDGGDTRAAGDGEGRVTLVTPDSTEGVGDGDGTGTQGGGANTAALQNELAIREENLDSLRRENDELRSRIGDLDDQVSISQRLLELRNEKIAALQDQLRRLSEEQGVEVDPQLLEEPATPMPVEPDGGIGDGAVGPNGETAGSTTNNESMANNPGGNGTDRADGADNADQNDTGGDAQDPASAQAQAKANAQAGADSNPATAPAKPKPAPAANSGGGFVDMIMANLLYIGAALAVLLLLILLAVRRRQADQGKDDDNDNGDDGFGGPGFADDDDGDFDTTPVNAGDQGTSSMDAQAVPEDDLDDEHMDPMERADVYVAYGQYPQAVDFLRNEINQAPERADLKIRLLELLRETNDDSGFRQQAAMFAGTSVAVDAAIKRLGGDATAAGGPAPADEDDQDYAAIADDPEEDGQEDEELSLDDLELDLASDLSGSDETVLGGHAYGDSTGEPEEDDDGLDLEDFDFRLDDEEPAGDDRAPALADRDQPLADRDQPLELDDLDFGAESDDQDDDSFEFTLDEDTGTDVSDTSFTEEELAALEGRSDKPSAEDRDDDGLMELDLDDLELDDLDVELDDDRGQGASLASGAADQPSSDAGLGDLELSLDDLELDDGDAPGDRALDSDLDSDLAFNDDQPEPARDESLDDLSLDLDDQGPLAGSPSEPAPGGVEGDDMLGDDDDFDFLGETDENATKLDLARAYIDMGDAEGARDILNEVLSEGSEEQQGEARELLSRVG